MSPNDIKAGGKYINRKKGKTWRQVQHISRDIHPPWSSNKPPPDEPGVMFIDNMGRVATLFLSSFASWAGREHVDTVLDKHSRVVKDPAKTGGWK